MKHTTFWVDFKTKTVLKSKSKNIKPKKSKYDFTHFNSIDPNSNFADFSEQERFEYSEHVLAYLHETTFEDLEHFVNSGMLDKKKLSKALGLVYENPVKSKKG